VLAVAFAVVAAGASACTTGSQAPPGSALAQQMTSSAEPTAAQLANGHWVVMAPVPFYFGSGPAKYADDPDPGEDADWDGTGIVYTGPNPQTGKLVAMSFDPRANRWTLLPDPPGTWVDPATFGGRDQFLMVSRQTGAVASYRPSTNRWTTLPRLPGKDVISLIGTGRTILAITVHYKDLKGHQVDTYHPAHAYELRGRVWTQLADLPRPTTGSVVEAPGAVYHGTVYVRAASVLSGGPPGNGSAQLLRLGAGGWTKVPGAGGLPLSNLTMHSIQGAILVTGAACPSDRDCLPKMAALIRPGRTAGVTVLRPPSGTGVADYAVTGGGSTVAVNSRSYWLYDVTTATWIKGPPRPPTRFDSRAYWTPYGVMSNGAVLLPARDR
jgi:hypothetical protein